MKKLLFAPLILAGALSAFADSFTDAIQDLAVQTACQGMYSATQAGGGWYDDPHDYYVPSMMAERFANMSGNMTRTMLFYGVCFDYAQFAWEDIKKYKNWYNQQGMYEGQFWLAGVHENPNNIRLSYPGTRNNHTSIQNGVYVIYPKNGLRNAKTHRHDNGKGDRATHHAWLWIERADGVWFWIDPTWTDNLGYVVYGYVKNGEEVQCRPDREYCINYFTYLDSLPLPPPMGARIAPSRSANSTDRNETIKDAASNLIDNLLESIFNNTNRGFKDSYIALVASINAPFSSIMDKSLSVNQMSFSLEMPIMLNNMGNSACVLGLEYLQNIDDDYRIHGGLLTLGLMRRLSNNITWYFGSGAGLRFNIMDEENHYAPDNSIAYLANTDIYAFKANTGFLLKISQLFTKIDVAYDNVIGFSVGAGIGFGAKI